MICANPKHLKLSVKRVLEVSEEYYTVKCKVTYLIKVAKHWGLNTEKMI